MCVDSSTSSSFCRKMPGPSGLTTFFLHFVGFVFFGVTGVAVGVPAMFMFTKDTFSTSFSIVVWGRAGIQFTPSISRVTVDSASRGIIASGHRSWFPFQRRVSFHKARTQIRYLESFLSERGFSCWYAVRLDVSLAFCGCLRLFCLYVTVWV